MALTTREWLTSYKRSLECGDCGMKFEDCPECADFHHINPDDKTASISELGTIRDILAELKKCIPLCANCHRKEEARIRFENNLGL